MQFFTLMFRNLHVIMLLYALVLSNIGIILCTY